MYKLVDTSIEGVKLIETICYRDQRGFLLKPYSAELLENLGIEFEVGEWLEIFSEKDVLRGMKLQLKHPQKRLIRVTYGLVYNVVVDLRRDSKTFMKWEGFYLDDGNKKSLLVPEGVANGFLTLSEKSIFTYLSSSKHFDQDTVGIVWNDAQINIQWPIDKVEKVVVSKGDSKLPTLQDFINKFD